MNAFNYYAVLLDYDTLLIEETEGCEYVKRIILFDGECNFCDKSVQFIIKRDPEAFFSFTSQQGEAGQKMIEKYHAPASINSIILIENDTYYLKSSAALRICRHLQGAWKLLFIFILVPYPIRDFFYNILAKNRYKWFGKKDQCTLPTPEMRKRFL